MATLNRMSLGGASPQNPWDSVSPDIVMEFTKARSNVSQALASYEEGESVAGALSDAITGLLGIVQRLGINLNDEILRRSASAPVTAEDKNPEVLSSGKPSNLVFRFVFHEGKFYVQEDGDRRPSGSFLRSLNLLGLEHSTPIQGEISENRVWFSTGDNFKPVENLPREYVERAIRHHIKIYGFAPENLRNGFSSSGCGWGPNSITLDDLK